MNRTHYIYLITNKTNNKKYIGQTINFKTRIREHIWGGKTKKPQLIDQKIKQYGKDNFTYELIEEIIGQKNADEKERYYIEKYNTMKPNGYNILEGGRSQFGAWNKKPILVYDLNGNFIKEYECADDLEKESNGKYQSNNRYARKSKTHRYKDILIKYKDDETIIKPFENIRKDKRKKVYQYDLKGKLINKYDSISIASQETNTNRTSIINCLKGIYKKANNYLWSYEDEKPIVHKDYLNNRKKPIYCLNDDKKVICKYDSCKQAEISLNLKENSYKLFYLYLNFSK